VSSSWPVARTYAGPSLVNVSLPVGGIGTGTVGYGGRGQFRDWELENHPSKGLRFPLTFLACHVAGAGARVLEGALFDNEVEGWMGATAPLAGLPRFGSCTFEACYPFGRVALADPSFPVSARVTAVNPLVPGDAEASGLPVGVFRVEVTSLSSTPVDVDLMFSVEAMVGHSSRALGLASSPSVETRSVPGLTGVLISDGAMDADHEEWGTVAAAVTGDGGWTGPTWGLGKWNQGLTAMWEGFAGSGRPSAGMFELGGVGATSEASIAGTLGASLHLPPGASSEIVFLLGWHFPNRRSWRGVPGKGPRGASGPEILGNHYCSLGADAWDVLVRSAPRLPALEETTARFVSAFWSSDLTPAVKEAALFNLSTLRSQTYFRTGDGYPFGWEGCLDDAGSCLGSCTHVWNYEHATGYLFGSLARQMRELEYLYATADDGGMSFRIDLPLSKAREFPLVAADGQFGCVVKLYRDWTLSGDDEWLRRIWPACRRSIEFAWIPGGWDGDRDGLAEGSQHNTMDVEYYGPTPVIQGWYLAALAAGAEMAVAVGDAEFAATCREVLASGQKLTEARLFRDGYYRQVIMPPRSFDDVPPRLRSRDMGAQLADHPEFQIGDGCLADQVVGDSYARLVGLGGVLSPDHVTAALGSVHRLNYIPDFGTWTNYMRTYAVHGERGHIVTSYPDGLPEHPMPYWSEVWTGLEYAYAIGLLLDGEAELAGDVVAAARERFTGARRNPFDEAECGHHYARAMASWGLVVAASGFGYDARAGEMTFAEADQPVTWFWSTGSAWGTVHQSPGSPPRLEILHGSLPPDTSVRLVPPAGRGA
jgi:non-lysosomal glucosylceramidase